jgi:NAD(P)-dependent dehydrogenase (short-subunit alcohol dehydrogenase family)
VRIVWVVSLLQAGTPPGAMSFDKNGTPVLLNGMANYMQSKAGAVWLSDEFSKRLGSKGILSVVSRPHTLREWKLADQKSERAPRPHEERPTATLGGFPNNGYGM